MSRICNTCQALSVSEKEQTIARRQYGKCLDHKCRKYNKTLYHWDKTGSIKPCKECIENTKED